VLSKLKLTRQNNLTVLLRYVIRLDVIGHLAMSDFARLIYHTSGRGLSRYCSFGGVSKPGCLCYDLLRWLSVPPLA